jgi:OmpA-OmpF porin, OOP family
VQIPVTYAETGDLSSLPPSSRGPTSLLGGFGDLRLTPRLALLRQEWAGIDLAAQASLELPTARDASLTGDGRVRAEGLVALGRRLGEVARGSVDLLANAYVRLRPPRELLDVKLGNEAGLRAGVAYAPPLVRAWLPRRVYGELEGRAFLRAGFANGSAPAEWRLGATLCPVRSLAIDVAGGGALTDGVGAPRARFLLGVGWSPAACGAATAALVAAAQPATATQEPPQPEPEVRAPPEPPAIAMVDSDTDGIADVNDSCPGAPGPAENQGCPPDVKQLVTVSASKIEILEQVRFGTGKARIDPRSSLLLDQVAAVLLTHPDLKLVQVEGHTDDRGGIMGNIILSQARAEAVAAYLEGKGVASSRLRAQGFGQGRPVVSNGTATGRAANRRVAFTVVQTRSRRIEAKRPGTS